MRHVELMCFIFAVMMTLERWISLSNLSNGEICYRAFSYGLLSQVKTNAEV